MALAGELQGLLPAADRALGRLDGAAQERPYEDRLKIPLRHRVALWDVCSSADRPGALDASIRQASAELYRRRVRSGLSEELQALRSEVLPSTSPAHAAMTFEQKLERWSIVREAAR